MKFKEFHTLSGEIRLVTGLHIGAGNDEVKIGGAQNPIIKNPVTEEPYIPGSSLKGKIRSLLEMYAPDLNGEDDPENSTVCRLFGSSNTKTPGNGPSRLIFRDAPLSETDREEFQGGRLEMELKHENSISFEKVTPKERDQEKKKEEKYKVTANPRTVERVPAGVRFNFEIVIREFEDDKLADTRDALGRGLHFLEMDALGGSGTRGYGQVKFENLQFDDKPTSIDELRKDPDAKAVDEER